MSIKLIEAGKKDLAPFMYPHKCVLESCDCVDGCIAKIAIRGVSLLCTNGHA